VTTVAVVGNPEPRSPMQAAAELVVERLTGAPADVVTAVPLMLAVLVEPGATTPTRRLHLMEKSWDAPRTAVIANELYRRSAVDLLRTASALCPAR
jgi:FMN reductase